MIPAREPVPQNILVLSDLAETEVAAEVAQRQVAGYALAEIQRI